MANPTKKWDQLPVFGWWRDTGQIKLDVPDRIRRVDGRMIYPGGTAKTLTIGADADQDPAARSEVRAALRALDQAANTMPDDSGPFDGTAWDVWWDSQLPYAIFTYFELTDDPDITPNGWQVKVTESLQSGKGKIYYVETLSALLANPVPGINLGDVEVPPGSPTAPAPVYAKGQPGGVAALDADGDVLNAAGDKVVASGVESVNGSDGEVVLSAADVGAVPNTRTVAGKPLSADVALVAGDVGAVPTTRTIAGKPLSADVSLVKADVGLGNVDNTADAAKPISTAAAAAFAAKADLVGGVVPTAQMPPLAISQPTVVASEAAMLALPAQRGDWAIRTDLGRTFVLATDNPGTLADWIMVSAAGDVTSVAGRIGAVTITAADVGDFSTTVEAEVGGMNLVTVGAMNAALTDVKPMRELSGPLAPLPADTVAGDWFLVPEEEIIPLLWSFDPTVLADGTTIVPLSGGSPTLSPDGYGQVQGTPTVAAAAGGFRKGILIPAATQINVRMENEAPASGDWAWACRMTLKAGSAPSSAAPYLYALAAAGGHIRGSLSTTRQIQIRNNAGSLVTGGTGPVWPDNAELSFTIFGTVGVSTCSVRVRNLTAGTDIFSLDNVAVGTSSPIDDMIVGRQSGSLGYGADMLVHEQRYAPVAQDLNQAW